MSKSTIRRLELDGKALAANLNIPDSHWIDSAERRRVETLVLKLNELIKKAAEWPQGHHKPGTFDQSVKPEIDFINAELQRHAWIVQLIAVGRNGPIFGDFDAGRSEGQLLMRMAAELARKGLLHRVRKCGWEGCGIWFFAGALKDRFHSTTCRQKWHRHTPEYREKAAKYQRKLYNDPMFGRSLAAKQYQIELARKREAKRDAKKR